jgi:hypothetical protein
MTFGLLGLSNSKIIISYEPESVDDQETINSFGGLDNTPAYLAALRPVLTIDDETVMIGTGGVLMGSDYTLAVTFVSPNGTQTVANSVISGNMTALGIVAEQAVVPAGINEEKASDLLYREAIRYIDNWNKGEAELASLLKVVHIRPLPTLVTLANTYDVTYADDQTPAGIEWKGLFLDADLKTIETVGSPEFGIGSEREKTFMQISGLQGSALESKLFEDAFGVTSVSTAKVFGVANSSQPAIPTLSIDQANIDAILPTLAFDGNIKQDIMDSVAQNLTIRIPESETLYQDWTGIGYIKENPATDEAGYMLSGMVAGGMTALGPLS